MVQLPSLEEMLQAGVHFGHNTSRWHPKMKPFIFTSRNNIYIINLERTRDQLVDALAFVQNIVAKGGSVLFVGTKRQARPLVKKAAEACGMPYVTTRWLGGTFTNFDTIKRVISHYAELEAEKARDGFAKYTKKERLLFEREMTKLEALVGGIRDMKKLPEAIFVVDVHYHRIAVQESMRQGIPIVGIVDTNSNPDGITKVIPANDDAVKVIEMMSSLVATAINEAKTEREKKLVQEVAAKAAAASAAQTPSASVAI